MAAISTIYTYFMVKSESTWKKVFDITSYSDLVGDTQMNDATTMSNKVQVNVPGVQQMGSGITFEGFFEDKEKYAEMKAMEGSEHEFALWIGGTDNGDGTSTPTGRVVKMGFKGYPTFGIPGANVNDLHKLKCTIANTNEPHVISD